jgi:Transposase IS116/IS110/IS902 family
LKQVKRVGTLIALTFLLTLEDPHRFGKSRDVGCYLGLQPGRRNSGQSQPQMHISKEGDPYLRTLLVQGAQHILGPFGVDCDLRRWGLKLAERGGKSGEAGHHCHGKKAGGVAASPVGQLRSVRAVAIPNFRYSFYSFPLLATVSFKRYHWYQSRECVSATTVQSHP